MRYAVHGWRFLATALLLFFSSSIFAAKSDFLGSWRGQISGEQFKITIWSYGSAEIEDLHALIWIGNYFEVARVLGYKQGTDAVYFFRKADKAPFALYRQAGAMYLEYWEALRTSAVAPSAEFNGTPARRIVLTPDSSSAAQIQAVEFYYGGSNHYFMTADAGEMAMVDSGAVGQWIRTGQTFRVESNGGGLGGAVCRFYCQTCSPGTHFYTLNSAECSWLQTVADWRFEGTAFRASAANGGSCVSGAPLFRLYNRNRSGAPNHRYTTCANLRDTMISRGWAYEGVAMCVPAGSEDCNTDVSGGGWTYPSAP